MADHPYVIALSLIAVLGLLAAISRGSRSPDRSTSRPRRPRSGAMLRFRPTRPGSRDWEPLRIAVSELRIHGLHRWPNAPGIYLARNGRIHCRQCVDDPAARAAIVRDSDDAHQVLVLFGGPSERALVDANCARCGPDKPGPTDQREQPDHPDRPGA